MNIHTNLAQYLGRSLMAALAALVLTGCHSAKNAATASTTPVATSPSPAVAAPAAVQPAPAAPVAAPAVQAKAAPGTVRIRVGDPANYTDSNGNIWLGDRGFADGEILSRAGDLKIENTKDQDLYRSERYGMTSFSYPLPNGKYTVRLHFAETFEGIGGPGERVFSFEVEGKVFKDFDVWVKAGGAQRAYIETVNVEITDGKLDIKFTPKVENPEINGIEIIPL